MNNPTANAQLGSVEFSSTGTTRNDIPTRLHNNTQVFSYQVHQEGSLIRSNTAHAKNAFMYSVDKRKLELRRDIERKALYWDQDSNAEETVTREASNVRYMGGIAAFAGIVTRAANTTIELNNAANTANAITSTQGVAYNVINDTNADFGQKVVQYTGAPTAVNLTDDHLTATFQGISEAGGDMDVIMVPTGLRNAVTKLLVSGDTGAIAERRVSDLSSRIQMSVDSVITEFGFDATIVHNYVMQSYAQNMSNVVLMFAKDKVKRAVLTPYDMEVDGTARYGKGALVFCEETLEVESPNSVAMLTGVQAS